MNNNNENSNNLEQRHNLSSRFVTENDRVNMDFMNPHGVTNYNRSQIVDIVDDIIDIHVDMFMDDYMNAYANSILIDYYTNVYMNSIMTPYFILDIKFVE